MFVHYMATVLSVDGSMTMPGISVQKYKYILIFAITKL